MFYTYNRYCSKGKMLTCRIYQLNIVEPFNKIQQLNAQRTHLDYEMALLPNDFSSEENPDFLAWPSKIVVKLSMFTEL